MINSKCPHGHRMNVCQAVSCVNKAQQAAKAELDYMQTINPAQPGTVFNNNPAVWAAYVTMQSRAAHYVGSVETSVAMLDCLPAESALTGDKHGAL